ncbi:MAG: hypothetical protein QHH80_08470 [Anaerolineae bacterium]|nr:hypothetical protein [Anaerolineae bacterium]
MKATRRAWAVLLVLLAVLALTATALAAGPYELLRYAVGAGVRNARAGRIRLPRASAKPRGNP